MKRTVFLFSVCVFLMATDREVYTQSAAVLLRPAYADISDQASRGAVLIRLAGYSSADARYRLFNGTTQYNCWNPAAGSYVTSNSYSSGPPVPGDPTRESVFWVAYLRGSNTSASATYRDRLGPDYSVNYQSAALPSAEPVTTSFVINGKLTASSVFTLDAKYVILAWNGENFVAASHSDPVTGEFMVVCPSGSVIDKIEVRTLINEICGSKSGTWNGTSDAGTIALSDVLGTRDKSMRENDIILYPIPAGEYLNVSGVMKPVKMEIFNLAGVKIREVGKDEFSAGVIQTGRLASGVYFLKVKEVTGEKVYRFVKR